MNFNKEYFNRLGAGLNLNNKQINGVYKRLVKWLPQAVQLIENSFLSEQMRESYRKLINQRTIMFV